MLRMRHGGFTIEGNLNPMETPTMAVAMDPAGVPADPKLRNAVLSFRSALSELALVPSYPGRRREDAVKDLDIRMKRFGCIGADAEEMLESLLEQKIIYLVKGKILPAARVAKRTSEERRAAFDQFVTAVAERTTEDAEGRRLLAQLIRMMTRLHGVHRVSTRRGDGIFIATDMDFVSGSPTVTKGVAVILNKMDLQVYHLTARSISLSWSDGWPSFSVHLAKAKLHKSDTEKLLQSTIFGEMSYTVLSDATRKSASASERLSRQREQIEAFIGLSLNGHKWNSFRMSMGRRKHLGRMAHMSIVGMLDPDIRRIALRSPSATFSFYRWVGDADPETLRRRAQMSEAFPVFTNRMKALDSVIRNGEPLIPALEKLTGLDAQRLRRLRGIHWQRLGRALRELVNDNEQCSFVLTRTDPSRFPTNRKEWNAFNEVARWEIVGHLSEAKRQAAKDAISRNWVGYQELKQKDFVQSISDTAENLLSLMDRHISSSRRPHHHKQALEKKILDHVAGDNFGLKRLRLFNEAWHKGTGQRSLRMRELKKGVFGEDRIASWKPLTEEAFACESGRLVWLTDEVQLLDEGRHMHHCVGSYWYQCIRGDSHIAQVLASDGSRSTVEFRISENGRVMVNQNYTYYDKNPSELCHAVVSKFIAKHRKTKFEIVQGDPGTRREVKVERATDEAIEALKAIYADCLPMSFMNEIEADGRRWMEANPGLSFEAADQARIDRENREYYERHPPRRRRRRRPQPAAVAVTEDDIDWEVDQFQPLAAAG
jgi:hypothetical protein